MQILEFNLEGQKLTKASDFPDVVSNSNKYLKMVVNGIPNGFVATAYFILSWDTTSVYNLVIENGEVYIDEYLTTLPKDPSEYFDYTLSVSIAAVNGDGVRITSNPIIIKIDKSNFSPETTNTPQIPENQIEEVLAKISPATSETHGTVKVADNKDMASIVGGIYPSESNGILTIAPATQNAIDMRFNDCAPIVPANLEYAVKSVGDGYYAKVGEAGGGGEKVYELINTITVTPGTDGTLPQHVIFSTDSEGNPFEMGSFYVKALIGATDGSAARLSLFVNDNPVFGGTNLGYMLGTTPTGWALQWIDLGENNGALCVAQGVPSGSTFPYSLNINSNTLLGGAILPYMTRYTPVKKIEFWLHVGTAKTFVAGSTFELWGVRK